MNGGDTEVPISPGLQYRWRWGFLHMLEDACYRASGGGVGKSRLGVQKPKDYRVEGGSRKDGSWQKAERCGIQWKTPCCCLQYAVASTNGNSIRIQNRRPNPTYCCPRCWPHPSLQVMQNKRDLCIACCAALHRRRIFEHLNIRYMQ